MEGIEFYNWDGQVRYRRDGTEHVLSQNDRDIIEFVLENLHTFFPEALEALDEECSKYKGNRRYYDFRRVERFIRCNFSEHDMLRFDIWNGVMNFEEVKCPLRGMCRHEGRICKPKFKVPVPKEEGKVAILYSKGLSVGEISRMLRKSIKTVKNQLESVRKRLKLDRTKDLIKVLGVYNITLWE